MGWSIDRRKVIDQTLDGETVIIDLDSGTYYSLEESACDIWLLLDVGHGEDRIVEILTGRYAASEPEVRAAVRGFVDELKGEGLLAYHDVDLGSAEAHAEPTQARGPRAQFTQPTISKFTDLQHLIALDPIHDVDAGAGWPRSA